MKHCTLESNRIRKVRKPDDFWGKEYIDIGCLPVQRYRQDVSEPTLFKQPLYEGADIMEVRDW